MEKHFFNVNIEWQKERMGTMSSPELTIEGSNDANSIQVATPPPFPKGMPNIWSPEHLFTASVSSCLMTTFLAVAENSKLDFSGFRCDSTGIMEKVDGKFLMTEITLKVTVSIKEEKDRERAERIVQKSEAACLISNSIKSKTSLEVIIEIN